MTLGGEGSPFFPLVVHHPTSASIWPAVQSLRPVCLQILGCKRSAYVDSVEEMMYVVCMSVLQREHCGDGCDLASLLCRYDLSKGELFVLSWARVQRVRRGTISSELIMCGGGERSSLVLPLVARSLTEDVNAHSTLWHSYTDDHIGQLIADVISNSNHITLNTNTTTRVPNTTLQQTSSPDITTVSNTLCNGTSCTTQHALSSDHLPIITTINIRHDYRLQQNRRTFTNYKKTDWTQFTEDTESAFAQTTIPTNIHTANRIFTNIILMADKHTIP